MIDVNRLILLLKQTKIVPAPEINKVKTVLKKLERGQKLNIKQMEIFQDIATTVDREDTITAKTAACVP